MKGQTIIEVLIALTTAVVIISAITIAVITSLRNAEYSRTQNSATRYAQEGLEYVRFMRDSNYPEFKAFLDDVAEDPTRVYCLGKNSTSLVANQDVLTDPCTATNVTIDNTFSRIISFDPANTNCAPLTPTPLPPPTPTIATPINTGAQVTVIVAWTDSKCIKLKNGSETEYESTGRCHQAKLVSCLSDYTLVPTP